MPYSAAQHRASVKYERENYDRISVMLPKGERDKVKAVAEAAGMSVTGWCRALIEKELAKQSKEES